MASQVAEPRNARGDVQSPRSPRMFSAISAL